MVIRRWATPFVWLAFTALATTVGLASVSVVRHAVIATSLQATSAKDITRVLDVPNASPTGEPTQTATNPILGPTSDSAHPVQTPLNTFTPTWSPTPTAAATPTRPVVPTYSHTSTARPTEPGDGAAPSGPRPLHRRAAWVCSSHMSSAPCPLGAVQDGPNWSVITRRPATVSPRSKRHRGPIR
jgi:hypothetical protein